MNATTYTIGGFSYGIGFSIGILLLITTITIASYFCTRTNEQQLSSNNAHLHGMHLGGHEVVLDVGIDEETIKGYPKLLYSDAKTEGKVSTTTSTCCSICLADYKCSDMLRMLPDCTHLFHVKCVDPWLRLHPTCPVCRTSPLPHRC